MKKKIGAFSVLTIIFLLFAQGSLAIGLGVSPAQLVYTNVLKGGYAQSSLYLSTDTTQNLSMYFEKRGDIADWILVEGNLTNITTSRNSPRIVKIIVQPPLDTANGNYTGTLRIVTDRIMDPETGVGSAVKAAFLVNIYVSVTGDEIKACSGGGADIFDAEIGYPLVISSIIKNDGNVRVSPQIFVDIWDKYQKEIVFSGTLESQSILPTESASIKKELAAPLSEEQYWANIKVPDCGISQVFSFNILEKGGVSDKGELIRVENKPWAKTDEIVPITAYFRNDGARTVSAKFKGEVMQGNEVVKVIDTDSIDAAPGEVIALQTFFRPAKVGQYFVKGRVYFNNKLTTEKASVINVNLKESTFGTKQIFFTYTLIFIGIIIIALLILIRKKKQKMTLKHHHRIR